MRGRGLILRSFAPSLLRSILLLRIQFDDQLLIQLDLHKVFPFGECLDLAFEGLAIHVDPVGSGRVRRSVARG
jgi:hypothetical protein